MVRTLDLRSRGRGFDSRSGRYQVLGWVTACGQMNHLSITDTKVNSAFHPSGVGESSTSLHGWGLWQTAFTRVGWQVTLCDPTWQVTSRSSVINFPLKSYTI